MDMKRIKGVTQITLSERNLRTLLLKLAEPASKRSLVRFTAEGALLVRAEPDEVHYANREAGEVHPREEAKLAQKG